MRFMSRFSSVSTVLFLFGTVITPLVSSDSSSTLILRICVPEKYWQECTDMMWDSTMKGIPISCISGRDRFECVEKVGRKEADVVAVDPEDMYLAAKDNQLGGSAGYNLVEQVRTKEEPEAPYRYEAVAVIRKDLNINSVEGLRGLKSCHTGVGRNVGYKIPITKLTAMGVLTNLNNPQYSARENELRALSTLFSKGCLVGTWSPDPSIDRRLKETYSNMCALCEKPDICDYPDIYSGYEGALRCLAHNGGDIAWTKVIYVKRFFGLPVGVSPAVPTSENPADFRYFCPDGSKVPIDANTKPCTWAARPWQGYMINKEMTAVPAVQKELTDLGKLGEEKKAAWWKDVMLLDEKTLAVAAPPISPRDHLLHAKYMDVIERNSGAPDRSSRWCVWDEASLSKCRALARAAFSRDARPRFDCTLQKNQEECLQIVRDEGADILVVDGGSVLHSTREFNARPIVAELYGPGSTKFGERPAVAVVKKSANITSFADLRGKKSCHSGYKGDFAGWSAPMHILKEKKLIEPSDDVSDMFEASCVPGAPPNSKLCQQCVGNILAEDDETRLATKCKPTSAELFNGGLGALECLCQGRGDVAFVPLPTLMEIDERKPLSGVRVSDFRLLCPEGGSADVENWSRCNLGLEPPRVMLSSAAKSIHALEEITHGTLAASSLYSKRPDLLKLFGPWAGQSNVLFRDGAIGLVSTDNSWDDKWDSWAETIRQYNATA